METAAALVARASWSAPVLWRFVWRDKAYARESLSASVTPPGQSGSLLPQSKTWRRVPATVLEYSRRQSDGSANDAQPHR